MDPNIIGGPRREAPEGLRNLPAPVRRTSPLDGLPVRAVPALLQLRWDRDHGRYGKDDGAGLGPNGRQR